MLLSTAQITRVLGVDASNARRTIGRWRDLGVEAQPLPSTGGRRSHGVAVDDVARMLGLRVEDVCVLAGVEGAS